MLVNLKIKIKPNDDNGEGCFFTKSNSELIVSNIAVPLSSDTSLKFLDFDNMVPTEGIIFKSQTIACWCGCDDQLLVIEIINKSLITKIAKPSLQFANTYDEDVKDDDNSNKEDDSDEEDDKQTYIKDNFPSKEITDLFSNPEYDNHWDCYCKYTKVCGCGCDPLHDGW